MENLRKKLESASLTNISPAKIFPTKTEGPKFSALSLNSNFYCTTGCTRFCKKTFASKSAETIQEITHFQEESAKKTFKLFTWYARLYMALKESFKSKINNCVHRRTNFQNVSATKTMWVKKSSKVFCGFSFTSSFTKSTQILYRDSSWAADIGVLRDFFRKMSSKL